MVDASRSRGDAVARPLVSGQSRNETSRANSPEAASFGGSDGVSQLLVDFDDRLPWKKTTGSITATEILRGSDDTGLVVVLADSDGEPTSGDLHAMWKARAGQSADPVLVMVSYPTIQGPRVAVLGPDRDAVPVSAVEEMTAARLATAALQTDSPIGLLADVRRKLASLRGGTGPGFRNEGLFATHVLAQQPQRPDWTSLSERSARLLSDRGEHLLTSLGYEVDHVPDGIVLRDTVDKRRHAAAVLLLDDESFDNPLGRFAGTTAVTHGLALARREEVPWLIVLGGSVARLYPADPDVGVGRKGQTQTYVEIDLDLLSESNAGYLALLFSPEALAKDGTVADLLAESSKYATGLSERLRDRIYEDVIPNLAVAVAAAHNVWDLPADEQRAALDEAYHQAMIILFRLLFVAYAEDRALLPLDVNEAYTSNALKTLARRILNDPDSGFSETSTSMWTDLIQIWDVIDTGDLEGMGVPAYNGGLFTRDPEKNPSGAATYGLRLTNAEIGPVLRGLMIDYTDDDVLGLVDFRSLDVREFGTIYEGLLESGLGIADTDLTVDSNDTYVPAGKKDEVWIEAGSIYFHSRSGSRKATGSYFTKPFAVQHLLDTALEPALDKHLAKVKALLDKGAHKSAAELLFDFRVADLAMGSAHFLVAAIDRIEARFSAFIALNPMPEVLAELHSLRETAAAQLGIPAEDSGIDDGILLRRQIARRCIYGIDINEIAVELARLAIWIHTFVPGLPLSFLNHGLVWGNSLTGVGTLEEIVQALEEAEKRETKTDAVGSSSGYIELALRDFLGRAQDHLEHLAALADASIADVNAAAVAQRKLAQALEPLAALSDLITAERTTRTLKRDDPQKIKLSGGGARLFTAVDAEQLSEAVNTHPSLLRAREVAAEVRAVHLPTRFPEVFRREPAGFDVILGNPPWEKLHLEEDTFWGLRFPGLLSMPQGKRLEEIVKLKAERPDLFATFQNEAQAASFSASIISAGPYPGIGAAHIDLFSAFCWRFWNEVRDRGVVGVVLPRAAMSGSGTAAWRRTVLGNGSITDLNTLTNSGRWAFDMEPRYTIALLTAVKDAASRRVCLRGPFANPGEYELGVRRPGAAPTEVEADEVLSWSDTASIPLVPASDIAVFARMRMSPSLAQRFESWRFRPVQGDSNTTKQQEFWNFEIDKPIKGTEIAVWSGRTFNLWMPESGTPYAYAGSRAFRRWLEERKPAQSKLKSSAFHEMAADWRSDPTVLPMDRPRIVFRDVCRSTDSRTMICALAPAGVALVEKAPYLLRIDGSEVEEAYLLGIMSSIPFDWFTRRIVELKMSFELLNTFPVPRVSLDSGRRLQGSGVEDSDSPDLRLVRDRVIDISGRLAAVDNRYLAWAREVGVKVGSVKTALEKDALIAELDALVSLLYGLSRDQVEQVFATFHRGWDYKPRLDAVLGHFDGWSARLDGGQ